MSRTAVYLDASAIVKLSIPEDGSKELRAYLETRPDQVTNDVGVVEVARAVRQRGGAAAARTNEVTSTLGRVDVDPAVVRIASAVAPVEMRTLDAIHLASAIGLGSALEAFVTYDRRLAKAAREAGLPVTSPGVDLHAG